MGTMGKSKPLAVVTGASSGIGYELAIQFAEHGFDLIICAEDAGIHEAARTMEGLGARTQAVQVDLATAAGVEKLYGEIQRAGTAVDSLVGNAGVGVDGEFDKTDLAAELKMINLNVVSTYHLTKLVAHDMVARGQGRILITASIAAIMPAPFLAVYGATKAFDLSFAASLHYELKDKGVTVTALEPGPTDTNFFHRAGMDDTQVGTEGKKKNSPADVAKDGFEALMAGKDRVVGATSMQTKLQGKVARFMPESVKAAQHAKMSEPGSAKK